MSGDDPAMAPPPWTITSKKRKTSPSVVFSGRKPQHRDETPSTARARQQTLTQAQWATTPSSFLDDSDMTPIGPATKTTKFKRMKKKESTLTQMDFFATGISMGSDTEDLSMMPEDIPDVENGPPQLDGNYESPRRRHKRKLTLTLKTESTESQEYQASQRSKESEVKSTASASDPRRSTRRKTRRSKILSDPADNFDYFNQALAASQIPPAQRAAALEIQNSVEEGYDLDISDPSPRHNLRTPNRPSTGQLVIKSSQSPESLPPSTRRTGRKTSEHPDRSPLRQRSANTRLPQPVAEALPEHASGQENVGQGIQSRLKRRKHQHKTTVDDSQTNLWSVQPTSSPEKQSWVVTTSQSTPTRVAPSIRASDSEQNPIEIPSTSQAEQIGTTDEATQSQGSTRRSESVNLLDQRATHHGTRIASIPASPEAIIAQSHSARESETDRRDFAATATSGPGTQSEPNEMPPPATPKTTRFTVIEDSQDEDSEFGSPILNDTQYNEEVKQRISSPPVSECLPSSRPQSAHKSPIPTPQLVRHSSADQRSQHVDSDSSSDGVSLPPAPPPTAILNGTITRVPLNDVHPSSSPPLASTKSATQRSVRPASMPHPSQISTQEATQGYLGSSYMLYETPRATEHITIKDSSSVCLAMSQIPPQPSQSQLNIDLGLDALDEGDEDGEDYDLDPPSSAPLQQRPATNAKAPVPNEIPTERIVPSSPLPSPRPAKRQYGNDLVDAVSRPSTATAAPSQSQQQLSSPVRTRSTTHADQARKQGEEPVQQQDQADDGDDGGEDLNPQPPASSSTSQPASYSSQPAPLARPLHEYTQLPGFNNDTQSDFTQHGHVSAAYVHRQREAGVLPKWYTPRPFKVPGYTRR